MAARAEDVIRAGPDDTALKMIQTIKPDFPLRLQREGVTNGEVRLVFEVSSRGKLVDLLIVAFTHSEFAHEVRRAVNTWKFEPGRVGGLPISTVVDMTFIFEYKFGNPAVLEKMATTMAYEPTNNYVYAPCPKELLDRAPEPIARVAPNYPKELSDQGIVGRVPVVFYVDESGRARMPVSTNDAHPVLAALAAEAVKLWQFDPPKRRGRPVMIRVSTDFVFVPREEQASVDRR